MPPGGCGHITMTVRIWLWVDLHRSRNWPWLHNVSTYDSLAKGEDYPNTLTHIVNGIYKGAGISGATSHSGRRTGLTNLAERGVGVRVLMALAGHSNMATTQRYIDLRPAMLKAAVELV